MFARNRIDDGRGDGTTAASASQYQMFYAAGMFDQRFFGFGGSDESHGSADDSSRPRTARFDQVQKMEQSGRRIADRDHGAFEFRPHNSTAAAERVLSIVFASNGT